MIDGEDIVQDTLARAFYALSLSAEVPSLRPWLFRIAHNAALDALKRHGAKYTDPMAEPDDLAGFEERPDPAVVRLAIARFLQLPLAQRSAVVLKDVLGHSLEETADTMGTTVMAVKAALVRGRRTLAEIDREAAEIDPAGREQLVRYAALFTARDWDGVRSMIRDDCRLDLVSKSQRQGRQVGMYFARYEQEQVALRGGLLEGRPALGAYVAGATTPSYFVLLDFAGGGVASIRDFRYVSYIATEAVFEPWADDAG